MIISENAASIFNVCEACLWLLIAVVFTFKFTRRQPVLSFYWMLPPAFAVFGVTDFIESITGAYWRPWWLLVMKIGCIAVFLFVALHHQRITRKKKSPPDNSPTPP